MKKFISAALAAIMLQGLAPAALAASPVRVTVDSTDLSPFGAFEGWGTSLCWWAESLGGEPEENRLELSKAFFDLEEGLGLNIVRYNIGAGDDPSHDHLNHGHDLRGLPVWVDENGNFNPDADPNQIAILKDAVSYGADIVECFSNSPPYYLTESGCSSGGKDSGENNISPENFDKFAEYLATVTEYIQKELGIEVASVSPMNEPATDYWGYGGTQEGCHIDPADHSALITAVHNALAKRGLSNVAVAAADENNSDWMAAYLSVYTDEALSYVPRLNVHSYQGGGVSIRKKAEELGKKLYMTEDDWAASIGYDAGSMGPAMWLSKKIVSDMRSMRPNAWICWQITGPGSNADNDSGYWYMSAYNTEKHELELYKKYYAFAHYTKFIRPGDYILASDSDNVLAARNFETGKTVLVVTNAGRKDEKYELDLSSLENLGSKITAYRTDNRRNLEPLENACVIENKVLKADIPVNSVTTFVIENEAPAAVTNMGLTLGGGAKSCFPGDVLEFNASAENGRVTFSAVGGTVSESGMFTAGETGAAAVTAAIDGTDLSASRKINIVDTGSVVRLVSLSSGLALQEDGERYSQYGDNDSAYQYWEIHKIGSVASFTNLRSGKPLRDGEGTEWTIELRDGGYSIINNLTGRALDVYGHSTSEGGQVGTYEYGGGANQLWNFIAGNLEPAVDALEPNASSARLVPLSVEGTAPYGGNEEVSFEKAFDGDISTHHDAWDGDNSYVSANMPKDKPVTLIRFYPRDGFDWRMYGGKFYGVKDGEETLLCTVPDKLKKDWNEIYLKNEVIYDQIVYRTPKGGLCNVAEIELYNVPVKAEMSCADGGVRLDMESFTDASIIALTVVYCGRDGVKRLDMTQIPLGEYEAVSVKKGLASGCEWAEVYVSYNGEIVTSGYIYLGKDLN